jgi:quercetin 2,3-dioxygenase
MREIKKVLTARESKLPGDFVVYRAMPRREFRRVGGFVFLDHFDEKKITPELFDVPPHPHVGLQTVTYLFEGEILHTDSLDCEQIIAPGDVNWMTAGRGITHAEQVIEIQPRIHGLQSWVGLPHDKRKIEPNFEHFAKESLPVIETDGVAIRVVAGKYCGRTSPIPTFQELVYLDISANAGSAYKATVDARHELALYVCEGSIEVSGHDLREHDLGQLTEGPRIAFRANENSRFVLFGGEPLPEPTVIYWNFITDTIGEAKHRVLDWEDGNFPSVRKYKKRHSGGGVATKDQMRLL